MGASYLKNKVTLISGFISLTCVVFLFSFFVFLYYPAFYDWQYQKNGIYEIFGYQETWDATHELWNYMQLKGEFTSSFFSSRDQIHMIDVRNLILGVRYVFFISSVVFLLILLYFFCFQKVYFHLFITNLFFYGSLSCFGILGLFGILALFFERSFVLFHQLLFSNNYWLMDPAVDKLVVLYPESFFLTYFGFTSGFAFFLALCLFFLSLYLRKKNI